MTRDPDPCSNCRRSTRRPLIATLTTRLPTATALPATQSSLSPVLLLPTLTAASRVIPRSSRGEIPPLPSFPRGVACSSSSCPLHSVVYYCTSPTKVVIGFWAAVTVAIGVMHSLPKSSPVHSHPQSMQYFQRSCTLALNCYARAFALTGALFGGGGGRYVRKGNSLLAMRKKTEAEQAFAKAAEIDPNHPEVWNRLALTSLLSGSALLPTIPLRESAIAPNNTAITNTDCFIIASCCGCGCCCCCGGRLFCVRPRFCKVCSAAGRITATRQARRDRSVPTRP